VKNNNSKSRSCFKSIFRLYFRLVQQASVFMSCACFGESRALCGGFNRHTRDTGSPLFHVPRSLTQELQARLHTRIVRKTSDPDAESKFLPAVILYKMLENCFQRLAVQRMFFCSLSICFFHLFALNPDNSDVEKFSLYISYADGARKNNDS